MIELTKYVYGLVDAPRHWYETLCDHLSSEAGGRQSSLDPSVFLWWNA